MRVHDHDVVHVPEITKRVGLLNAFVMYFRRIHVDTKLNSRAGHSTEVPQSWFEVEQALSEMALSHNAINARANLLMNIGVSVRSEV